MVKKYIIFFFVIVFVLGYFFLQNTNKINNRNSKINDNPAAYAFEQFKKTCSIPDIPNTTNQGNKRYINQIIGFEFEYTDDMIVCERPFLEIVSDYRMGISVWDKDDFVSGVPKNGPRVVIHIDQQFINEQFNQLSERDAETKLLGEKRVLMKYVKRVVCDGPECPIFTIYEFEHNEHSFVIEERRKTETIFDSFEFL